MLYRTWITMTFPTPLVFRYHLPLRAFESIVHQKPGSNLNWLNCCLYIFSLRFIFIVLFPRMGLNWQMDTRRSCPASTLRNSSQLTSGLPQRPPSSSTHGWRRGPRTGSRISLLQTCLVIRSRWSSSMPSTSKVLIFVLKHSLLLLKVNCCVWP